MWSVRKRRIERQYIALDIAIACACFSRYSASASFSSCFFSASLSLGRGGGFWPSSHTTLRWQ